MIQLLADLAATLVTFKMTETRVVDVLLQVPQKMEGGRGCVCVRILC